MTDVYVFVAGFIVGCIFMGLFYLKVKADAKQLRSRLDGYAARTMAEIKTSAEAAAKRLPRL